MTAQPTSVLSKELLPVSIAIFATAAMASFQALGIAAALPDIATDLENVSLLPWVITAFLLTSSLATVTAGPLIDSFGVSTMFRVAVVVFTIMGFASAFATSMEMLIALRAFQGVGAGFVLSTGTAAISLIYPKHLIARAFAANATVWGIMGVAGPAIAAVILSFLSWQWIFYLILPFGAVALVMGWNVLRGPVGDHKHRLDAWGTILLGVILLALVNAFDTLGWDSIPWLLGAIPVIWALVDHLKRAKNSVIRLEHLARQPLRGIAVTTALMITGTFAMSTYIPLYVRAGLGGSAALAAWSVLPLTVGWTIGANISSRLAARRPPSRLVSLGFFVNIPALIAAWLLALIDAPLAFSFVCYFAAGIGVGISTNASLTMLQTAATPEEMGRVSGAHLFARNQGFTFGAAIGGGVLLAVVTVLLGDPELVRVIIESGSSDSVPGGADAVNSGFAWAVLVGAALSALGAIGAHRLRVFSDGQTMA